MSIKFMGFKAENRKYDRFVSVEYGKGKTIGFSADIESAYETIADTYYKKYVYPVLKLFDLKDVDYRYEMGKKLLSAISQNEIRDEDFEIQKVIIGDGELELTYYVHQFKPIGYIQYTNKFYRRILEKKEIEELQQLFASNMAGIAQMPNYQQIVMQFMSGDKEQMISALLEFDEFEANQKREFAENAPKIQIVYFSHISFTNSKGEQLTSLIEHDNWLIGVFDRPIDQFVIDNFCWQEFDM